MIYLPFLALGIIIVWKFTFTAGGAVKSVKKHGVYSSSREAYVKTSKQLHSENPENQVWPDGTPEDFNITVTKPTRSYIYVTENYTGDLEIENNEIKIEDDKTGGK